MLESAFFETIVFLLSDRRSDFGSGGVATHQHASVPSLGRLYAKGGSGGGTRTPDLRIMIPRTTAVIVDEIARVS